MTQKELEGKEENLKDNTGNVIELQIEAVARECRTYQDSPSRGVLSSGLWYNVRGATEEIINEFFNENMFAKGNTVKVELGIQNTIKFVSLVKKAEKSEDHDMMNLDMLLDTAHKNGLIGIETEMVFHDFKEKIVIFKATVSMKSAKTKMVADKLSSDVNVFTGYGDAIPDLKEEYKNKYGEDKIAYNMESATIRPHYIRMAETRAICRALRWATNNATAAKEECE